MEVANSASDQTIESRAGLLGGGIGGELALARGLAGEIGMAVDQRALAVRAGGAHRVGHRLVECREASRTAAPRQLRPPPTARARRRRRAPRQSALRSAALRVSSAMCASMPTTSLHAMIGSGGDRRRCSRCQCRAISSRGRDPDPVDACDVVEKTRERGGAAGPAGQPAVQADRHHLRRALAFGVEHVEAVAQIGEEVVAGGEALRVDEAHVVGVERVGNDQVRPFGPLTQ